MSFFSNRAKPRPDIRRNRQAWNESWENDLAAYYGRGVIIPISSMPQSGFSTQRESNAALDTIQVTKAICGLQQDFACRVVESLAVDNFEAEWRHLPDARRRELVLEGICRASINGGRDMEDRRMWCPEITVSGLAEQQGADFMALVKKLLPANVHSPIVEPIYVSHPIMDEVLRDEGTSKEISAGVHAIRLNRTYFLSTVAWQITLAFYGVEEPAFIGKPIDSVKRHIKHFVADKFGPDVAAQMMHEYKDEHHGMRNTCWHCQQAAPSGRKFSACSACRQKANRYIRYCSRECQRADWKSHRQICGLKVIDPEIGVPKPVQIDTDELIPTPIPPFVRPPALLHQLTYLKTLPEADYTFIHHVPLHVAAQRILLPPQVPGRREFLVMRRRALCTGNPAAVCWMFRILSKLAIATKFSVKQLKEQLEGEYGINLDDITPAEKVAPVTAEEKAIVERSGRMRAEDYDWVS